MDQLKEKDRIETLIQSLSRFSEKVLLLLSGKTDVSASAKKIGSALIFQRLWEGLGIEKVLKRLLSERKFEFDAERAIFLTVLHRLFVSGFRGGSYWGSISYQAVLYCGRSWDDKR